jgi:hypothetical protein
MGGDDGAMAIGGSGSIVTESVVGMRCVACGLCCYVIGTSVMRCGVEREAQGPSVERTWGALRLEVLDCSSSQLITKVPRIKPKV